MDKARCQAALVITSLLILRGAGRNVHHMVEASVEVLLIYRQIGNSRHIDCDDADGTGTLS